MVKKTCKICNKVFKIKKYRIKIAKYCSVKCYRKDPDWKRKISKIHKGKCYAPNTCFKKGHAVPKKWRKAVSKRQKGNVPWNKGSKGVMKAWNKGKPAFWAKDNKWNKGRTPWNKGKGTKCKEAELIRASLKYRIWRKKVFKRDNYTCRDCGQKGGKLNADHIKRFSDYPKLRFKVSNGKTLCEKCHLKTPTFGNRKINN